MKRFVMLPLLLLLCGFEMDRTGEPLTITVYTYGSISAVQQALYQLEEEAIVSRKVGIREIEGWSSWNHKTNACDVHIVGPKKRITGRVRSDLGHEIAHCLYGRWHN